RARNRVISELDGRLAQNAAFHIRTQTCASIAVKEAKTEFSRIFINTAFAGARNLSRTHQDLYARNRKPQQFADQCGIDNECIVTNLDRGLSGYRGAGALETSNHRNTP